METKRDFIKRQLNGAKTIWRYTRTADFTYTKIHNVVLVCRRQGNRRTVETISIEKAVERLARNFNQIYKVGKGG